MGSPLLIGISDAPWGVYFAFLYTINQMLMLPDLGVRSAEAARTLLLRDRFRAAAMSETRDAGPGVVRYDSRRPLALRGDVKTL